MNKKNEEITRKNIAVVFPKDSESFFNDSRKTFGGATVQLFNYARELSHIHNVAALLPASSRVDKLSSSSMKIVHTFDPCESMPAKILKFHRVIRKLKPDIILQRGLASLSPFMAMYCRLFSIKYVFMFAHDREVRGRYQRTEKQNRLYFLLLIFSRYLIVQNEYQRKNISRRFNYKVSKITNGYEIEGDFFPGKNGVLWVSRLEPWKKPECFIELAEKMPDVPFVMVAPTVSGYESFAKEVYRRADGVDNLTIMDFVPFNEIDGYFQRARVFVNTSLEEGFPNTFVQACKNYTPVVSLTVNPDNFIERYRLGFFCNDDDRILFNAVKKILKNERLFDQFSRAAYSYAGEHHCIKRNTRELEECLNC